MIIALGSLLYVSHILIFSFFCFLTYGYYLITHILKEDNGNFSLVLPPLKQWLIFTLPYLFFAYLLYRYVNKPDPFTEANASFDIYIFPSLSQKTLELLYMPWNMTGDNNIYYISALFMLLSPLLMGYTLSKQINKYILLFGFIIVWYALPSEAFHTSMIYQRFSIFFIPMYFLIWQADKPRNLVKYWKSLIGTSMLAISIGYWMLNLYNNNIQFEKAIDTTTFLKILPQMQPSKRMLTFYDANLRSSGTLSSDMEYIYFGNWYQAEFLGWTDFNFAWFHPQIVRFKLNANSEKSSLGPWVTEPVFTSLNKCKDYDIFLMKTKIPPPVIQSWINQNPACIGMIFKKNENDWLLFERQIDK